MEGGSSLCWGHGVEGPGTARQLECTEGVTGMAGRRGAHRQKHSYMKRAHGWHSAEHLSVRGCEGSFEARQKLLERMTGERAPIHTGPQLVFAPTCQTGKPSSPGGFRAST